MIVILMGVSGSGKTTIGKAIEAQTAATFADADDYHSAANKAKMAAGQPLNDDDRQPWLETLNGLLLGWYRAGTDGVLACSALKEKYRDTLGAGMPADAMHFVLLDAPKQMIADRLAERKHSFMNPALLDSQLQTLERSDETYAVCNDKAPAVVAAEIVEHVGWKGKG